ncbi:MAG: DnaJ domain-containing protein [Rhodospirillaceae bacterium]|nr:DnaJ domain-containing protein [Rhodospirillaceae bacterium]MBT5911403.1 DnaJ domain-containing protein [Rhodospirillaceae bacterium]MBT7732865.1 DnaJ domain-containing protein [Rhodospirillaceae bacterium]
MIQQIRRAAKTASGPAKGQVSSVNTEFLEMNLNHDTGEMSGLVKKGEKKGYRIETLNLNQLLELIEESKSDSASIQLLERFLDKYFDENWRETYQSSSDRYENNNDYSSDSISRAQALKILGLVEPVTDEQIKEAHRRLILANHPDRGGSTFLATQINKAKDVLLENVK